MGKLTDEDGKNITIFSESNFQKYSSVFYPVNNSFHELESNILRNIYFIGNWSVACPHFDVYVYFY